MIFSQGCGHGMRQQQLLRWKRNNWYTMYFPHFYRQQQQHFAKLFNVIANKNSARKSRWPADRKTLTWDRAEPFPCYGHRFLFTLCSCPLFSFDAFCRLLLLFHSFAAALVLSLNHRSAFVSSSSVALSARGEREKLFIPLILMALFVDVVSRCRVTQHLPSMPAY